jgi:hypothetical protein
MPLSLRVLGDRNALMPPARAGHRQIVALSRVTP